MRTAMVYLATSITLAVILTIARRAHHVNIGRREVYRYPPLLVRLVAFFTPVYGAAAAFIYSRDPQLPKTTGFVVALTVVFGGLLIGNSVAFLYFRSFVIEVGDSSVLRRSWGRQRLISYDEIAVIVTVKGWGGGGDTRLYDQQNRLRLKITSSIQDYDDLIWSIKNHTRRSNVIVRERDSLGKWSESVNL